MRSLIAKENAKKREKARVEKGKRNAEKFVDTSMLFAVLLIYEN